MPTEWPQRERTTGFYQATLLDHTGTTVPGSVLSTLTLTLYADDAPQTILNGRNAQNVLNLNGVTVTDAASGNVQWEIAKDDNVILDNALEYERHIALFTYTWPPGRQAHHEVVLVVENLSKVT